MYYVVGDSTKHMRDFDRIGVAVAHAAVLLNNIDPKNIDAEATAAIDTSGRWQRGGIYVTDAGTIRRRLCSVSRACMEPFVVSLPHQLAGCSDPSGTPDAGLVWCRSL